MIRVDDLSHAYDDELVLTDVTLRLPRGQVTALVGPNGAGKSTLLSAMARLLSPDSGRVLVDELAVADAPADVVARRLAVLRQDNRVAARLTVLDLVRFGRFPYCQGRLRQEDHRVVAECLDYVQLGELRDRYLDQLSGGQRQRAFIAMVLAQETDYLLLDEPLNNLDMAHATAAMQLVRRAAEELGRTVVVVLHDINMASCYADRIVGMREGRVTVQGTPAEVMREEVLSDLFGLTIPVHRVGGHLVGMHWAPGPVPAAAG
ncbi:iron ABC transporter ATP-binding protein [Ornithinicoccus halotolerans]|uniref:iron ABC transporter ATP-binding protein n=1 Tax=Ornithinicoccus halotolerans TaxID=1748220 RepID=UPI001297BE84|nr:ATP-binding cassette domain-containing protein [Ornithinicoccus halotolerans]